jgi:O-antigen ligase
MVLWGIMCALSIAGLAYSQSRSAWLASAVVMPIAIVCKLKQTKKLKLKTFLLIGLLIIITAAVINFPKIVERRIGPGIDSASITALTFVALCDCLG